MIGSTASADQLSIKYSYIRLINKIQKSPKTAACQDSYRFKNNIKSLKNKIYDIYLKEKSKDFAEFEIRPIDRALKSISDNYFYLSKNENQPEIIVNVYDSNSNKTYTLFSNTIDSSHDKNHPINLLIYEGKKSIQDIDQDLYHKNGKLKKNPTYQIKIIDGLELKVGSNFIKKSNFVISNDADDNDYIILDGKINPCSSLSDNLISKLNANYEKILITMLSEQKTECDEQLEKLSTILKDTKIKYEKAENYVGSYSNNLNKKLPF